MIVQKFGTPGHSAIQEVDNLHSQIEKTLSHSEVFSPVGLLRVLLLVDRRNPLRTRKYERYSTTKTVLW